jgi:hypothetical protein
MAIILNVPHIFQYNKIDDCRLPEGRISIPFAFRLVNPSGTIPPIISPIGQFAGDFFLLDFTSIVNGVKPISGIKSLELNLRFIIGSELKWFPLFVLVQDSQQMFSLCPVIPFPTVVGTPAHMKVMLPIISNAPTKIWFMTSNDGSDTSNIEVVGNAYNFEIEPYFFQGN